MLKHFGETSPFAKRMADRGRVGSCCSFYMDGLSMISQDRIIQKIGELGGRLRVKSALNPVLWLCLIVTAPSIFWFFKFQVTPPWWLIFIICAPVCCGLFGFVFLLFVDRDKLQSEDFQIRKQSLELIQEKGDKFPVFKASIQAITNPSYSQLSSDKMEADL